MNAFNMAQTAYTSSIAPVKTERGTEYDAFSHVTRALKATSEKSDYPAFIAALHENRKLWTLLAVDVADADNGLPRQLRAQLFYLAEFTQKHTSQIIAGRADSAPLIDVNTSVMRGLRHGRGGA